VRCEDGVIEDAGIDGAGGEVAYVIDKTVRGCDKENEGCSPAELKVSAANAAIVGYCEK
jgi:hypothetical protein